MSGLLSFCINKSCLHNLCNFVIHSEITRWIGSLGLVWGRVIVTYSVHQMAVISSLKSRVVHVMGLCPGYLMPHTVDANWRALVFFLGPAGWGGGL